jgi:solute carrier family 35 protein F1/2
MAENKDNVDVTAKAAGEDISSQCGPNTAGSAECADGNGNGGMAVAADLVDSSKKGFLAYFHTKEFYAILILG